MHEELEGTGTLRRIELPPAEWRVRYRFDIETKVVERPGFPRVEAHSSSRGTVIAMSGEDIPVGIYQLTAENGETLRVKNVGITWAILAPVG